MDCVLTAMMLTKSFSPSVSNIVLMVCLAMVSLSPFILPLTSTTMTTSFGEVAAWIYLKGTQPIEGRKWLKRHGVA